MTIRQDASALALRIGNAEQVFRRGSVDRVVVHEPALGPVRLYAPDGVLLATLNPPARATLAWSVFSPSAMKKWDGTLLSEDA